MQLKRVFRLAWMISLFVWGPFPATIHADPFKVLVVMSYEQKNPWCIEIKEGIDSKLADTSEITYF